MKHAADDGDVERPKRGLREPMELPGSQYKRDVTRNPETVGCRGEIEIEVAGKRSASRGERQAAEPAVDDDDGVFPHLANGGANPANIHYASGVRSDMREEHCETLICRVVTKPPAQRELELIVVGE